jgi:hypothetical protein
VGHADWTCAQANRQGDASALRWQTVEQEFSVSTLIIVLLVLWLLGLVTSYTLGGFIHLLLVLAVIVVLFRVIQGRDPLRA